MKKLRFLVSLITQDNDYQREQGGAAEEMARRLDVDLEILYSGSDAIHQGEQLLKVIQGPAEARPDAIIVEPAGTGMPHVAKAATIAGIGWAVMNCDADYIPALRAAAGVPVCAVNTDNAEVGKIQAKQFAALLPNGGMVLYIEGPAGSVPAQQRKMGMNATLPHNIEIRTLKGAWTELSGFKAASSLLKLSTSRELRVGVVGSQNDAMALGARRAVQDLGEGDERRQWLHLPFTGCDGVPDTGQAWVRRGLLAATVVTPPLTRVAMEQLVNSIQLGIQPPERTLIQPSSFPAIDKLGAGAGMSAKTGR